MPWTTSTYETKDDLYSNRDEDFVESFYSEPSVFNQPTEADCWDGDDSACE